MEWKQSKQSFENKQAALASLTWKWLEEGFDSNSGDTTILGTDAQAGTEKRSEFSEWFTTKP